MNWNDLSEGEKKILSLAGITKAEFEEAKKNWHGTTYPYDIKITEDSEWIRGRFTQAEVNELWPYSFRIRNMGGFGIPKSDLKYGVVNASNFKVEDGKLVFMPTPPAAEDIEPVDAHEVLAQTVLDLKEEVSALQDRIKRIEEQ